MRSVYDDPDPGVALLEKVQYPNLVFFGEHDVIFIKPRELLARCLPNVKHAVLDGLGHMTAIEDLKCTTAELLSLLREI
ncbi:MAG: hypothetical protein P8R42_02090 [Candidatus Binatia bacterium]|nr:hypothetical protein [Candidatus Binatia bacterium]